MMQKKMWLLIVFILCVLSILYTHGTKTATGQRLVDSINGTTEEDQQARTIRFAMIGDYGTQRSQSIQVASLVNRWQPEFIVTLGDNNYPDGEASTIDNNIGRYYHAYIYPYTGEFSGGNAPPNRFWPVLGNHDWNALTCSGGSNGGNNGRNNGESCQGPYFDYFTLPNNERYYDFVEGPIHFFMLDSDEREPDGNSATSPQAQWLHDQLSTANEAWRVVVLHHSPYSSSTEHGSDPVVQWPFAEWGADVVVSGHNHNYERLLVDGIPYLVNGAGGVDLYPMSTPLPQSKKRYDRQNGALLVEAHNTRLTFQFFDIEGQLIDKYALRKPAEIPTETPAETPTETSTETPAETPAETPTGMPGTPFPTATTSPTPNATPPQGTVLDVAVQQGMDDVEQNLNSGQIITASSDIELTRDPEAETQQVIGLRFTGISVAKNATIHRAYLEFTVDEIWEIPTSLVIQAIAQESAAPFSQTPFSLSSLPTSNTRISWEGLPPWTTLGLTQQTPDLGGIVQELVNQPGWQSGNAIALMITGDGRRTAVAYDGNPRAAARLHIEYEATPCVALSSTEADPCANESYRLLLPLVRR